MDKQEKERLQALIEAKKQGRPPVFPGRQEIYGANGQARKGVKKFKKGGLFDK
jgi:hypothetical protein